MMTISRLEANLLLYALDAYLGVDEQGKLQTVMPGYFKRTVQALRDRLFAQHEHPPLREGG